MKSKLIEKISHITIYLVCFLLFAGCMVPNKTLLPTNPAQKTIEPTNTPKTLIVSKTITPSLRVTTGAQILPSLSPRILPTYTADEAKGIIQNLLQDNGGCQLPCVWKVIPSQASLNQVKDFFSKFGKLEENKSFYSNSNVYDSFGDLTTILWNEHLRTFINFSYYQNNNLIDSSILYIEFTQEEKGGASIKPVYGDPYFSELLHYYLLPQVLSHYEKPSQILLLPFPTNPDREDIKPLFSLVLLYEDLGFLVEYLFPRESNKNNYIGCPSKTAYITLVSWDPDTKPMVENMVQRTTGLGINKLNFSNFKTLEDVTTMQKDYFENLFKSDHEQACISTPKNRWNNVP